MVDFMMPKLGADMTAGILVQWRKKPGEPVRRGDVLAEVETEKGVIDVEAFVNGVLESVLVQPGETVPVGTPLARIQEQVDVAAPAAMPSVEASAVALAPRATPASAAPPSNMQVTPTGRSPRASPAARKLARELEVDLAKLAGSGPGGAILREDIERAAAASKQPAPAPSAAAPMLDRAGRLRKTIAASMSRSKREIPHYYLSTTICLHRGLAWLGEQNQSRPLPERLLPGVLLLKAVALALHEVPELNATWDGEQVCMGKAIHLGVAISLRQGGLIAPAIHDADRLSLGELMLQFRDLVSRARASSLRSSELADPTITVTSLGDQGVETVFPIIYPPQVAIVGFGKILERPWAESGQVAVRPVVTATLAADHRVSDGHRGGLFLAAVERLLQEPEKL